MPYMDLEPRKASEMSPAVRPQASSSLDAAIHLWDVDSGQKIRSVENGPMDAWTVTFSPCAQKIVSGSHVGKINMFCTETGQSEQGKSHPFVS